VPKVLYSSVTAIEDQHFEEHWGVDFPRMFSAAVRNVVKGRITGGASTITMQLAGNLFLDRSDRSFRRKMQEILLALQIERRYTKPQIFTMYANQVYLAHGNYGFAAASQFYFGKPVTDLKLQEAALLAGMVNGPKFSPLTNPDLALNRRNLVIHRMKRKARSRPRMRRLPGKRRSVCTSSIRAMTWRPTSSKIFASILNPRMAQKRSMSEGCVFTRR